MTKTFFTLIICCFTGMQIYAQSPDSFQYQALVRNNTGEILTNTNATVSFKIHKGTTNGDIIFSETHQTTSSATGIISLQIGKGTAGHARIEQINWADGPYFIETEINYDEGTINIGTQQLMSVPFAKYAKNAENVKLKSPNGNTWTIAIDNDGKITTTQVTE